METQKRDPFDRRLAALKAERESWISHWRDLSEHIQPRRGRFLSTDRNKGDKRNAKIVDNTGTLAHRTLAAGMMAGLTSPARPWFRLATPDRELMEFHTVREWLQKVEGLMRQVFLTSNIYNGLQSVYEELALFGSAAMPMLKDFDSVVRVYPLTAGEYMLAQNDRMEIDAVYREFSMTVGQVVKRFGTENLSMAAKALVERGQWDAWLDVCYALEPNADRDPEHFEAARTMPYREVYWEKGGDKDTFLAESGYEEFPVAAPRWHVAPTDIYGRSPAMDALGDIKALQIEQKRKAQAIDKMVNPPLKAPTALRGQPMTQLPGGVTFVDDMTQTQFAPLFQIEPRLQEFMLDIREHQDRIRQAFYADLFAMLLSSDRRDMTATEVAARQEEKLVLLGPVLERLHNELLEPVIARTFGVLLAEGALPEAPDDLAGESLEVEYISLLDQAQQLAGISGIERLAGFAGSLAATQPDVLDKIDGDQMIDEYGNSIGVPINIIRSDDEVEKLRAGRNQQAQMSQGIEMMNQAAQGAKTLGETDISGAGALGQILGGGVA